ncbi:MAG: alpha/beta fold hydrolase [Dehalococcoidia bacterium]
MAIAPGPGPQPEGTMVNVGNEQIHLIELGDPNGKPLVFLHGGGPGGNAWTDFGMIVPFFQDRRIIMPDLLGWGLSSYTPSNEPTWSRQSWHLNELLGMLGVENADFACSSQGGTASLTLAAEYPNRVRRTVISGSQPTFETVGEDPAPGKAMALIQELFGGDGPDFESSKALMAGLEWHDGSRIPDETVELRLKQTLLPDTMAAWKDWSIRGARQDIGDLLPKIEAPVLMLWGKYDPFLSLEYAVWLCRQIKNSDVYIMDKASHHGEEEWPADYSAIIKAFFEREAFGN